MSHNFLGTRGRVLSIKSSLCSHGVDSLVGRTGNEQKKKMSEERERNAKQGWCALRLRGGAI